MARWAMRAWGTPGVDGLHAERHGSDGIGLSAATAASAPPQQRHLRDREQGSIATATAVSLTFIGAVALAMLAYGGLAL